MHAYRFRILIRLRHFSSSHIFPSCLLRRFGVEQRGRLLAKASPVPHVLHMTATPIPRTQALIDHGNMTQVLIQQLPAGRTPVLTRMLQDDSPERQQVRWAAWDVVLLSELCAPRPRPNQVRDPHPMPTDV